MSNNLLYSMVVENRFGFKYEFRYLCPFPAKSSYDVLKWSWEDESILLEVAFMSTTRKDVVWNKVIGPGYNLAVFQATMEAVQFIHGQK